MKWAMGDAGDARANENEGSVTKNPDSLICAHNSCYRITASAPSYQGTRQGLERSRATGGGGIFYGRFRGRTRLGLLSLSVARTEPATQP